MTTSRQAARCYLPLKAETLGQRGWAIIILAVLASMTGASHAATVVSDATPATLWQYLSGSDSEHTVPWEFFCTAGRNSGKWTTIAVPSCWEMQGFGEFHYGLEEKPTVGEQGQYRYRFAVPANWTGRRVFIVCDGVMTDADIKINGASAGPVHQGAFYRFKYDITPLLKFGQENLLEMTVSKKSADESVNRAERYADYWVFGGVFRPVRLMAVPGQFIDHVGINARADGSFNMDFQLGGEGQADAVEVTILDAQGKPVGAPTMAPLAAARVSLQVRQPALWSAETPSLYTAVVRLKQGAIVRHEIRQRFGFRTIEVRPGSGIYVNSQRVLLKGVCRHSFWPTTGRTLNEKVHRLDIGLIKDMNMNAVRMSHYPPDEQFLDLCDELGLYVLDELAGWQKKYDTGVGRQRVVEMLARDVNHPSILFWDNGNEGGWNTDLDNDFKKLDPQQRTVIHPWANFGGINDKHYPSYNALATMLRAGDIAMPTEFLHGLYDGGGGAGLADYWDLMRQSKAGGGGFLWSFLDEGVQRPDKANAIDVKGNWAPDGVVGPFREKEGSFYAIKEIWSPIYISRALPPEFNGSLKVENRYSFTNLASCRFDWQLRRFGAGSVYTPLQQGTVKGPDAPPGSTATLQLPVPRDFRGADALSLKASDATGREIWTWVWPLKTARESAAQLVSVAKPVAPVIAGDEIHLQAGPTLWRIAKDGGTLLGVSVGTTPVSLTGGAGRHAAWTLDTSGWMTLNYDYDPATDPKGVAGIAFDYPEANILKKTWLGEGPYRVWKNRVAGGALNVWENNFNATVTGYQDWIYPEFSGYFANVRWTKLTTTEGTLTLVVPTEDTFVRVGTPQQPEAKLSGHTHIDFPPGNIAVLQDIPAMGNKFQGLDSLGPQSVNKLVTAPYHGTLYLRFNPK